MGDVKCEMVNGRCIMGDGYCRSIRKRKVREWTDNNSYFAEDDGSLDLHNAGNIACFASR